jgi:hypothetical protein
MESKTGPYLPLFFAASHIPSKPFWHLESLLLVDPFSDREKES